MLLTGCAQKHCLDSRENEEISCRDTFDVFGETKAKEGDSDESDD